MPSKLKAKSPVTPPPPVMIQAHWGEGSLQLSSHGDAGGRLCSSSLKVTGSCRIQLNFHASYILKRLIHGRLFSAISSCSSQAGENNSDGICVNKHKLTHMHREISQSLVSTTEVAAPTPKAPPNTLVALPSPLSSPPPIGRDEAKCHGQETPEYP